MPSRKESMVVESSNRKKPLDIASYIEDLDRALTACELAKLLGVAKSTLYDRAKSGRIPHIRLGTSIRFDCYEIARWLRRTTVPLDYTRVHSRASQQR